MCVFRVIGCDCHRQQTCPSGPVACDLEEPFRHRLGVPQAVPYLHQRQKNAANVALNSSHRALGSGEALNERMAAFT